MAYVVRIVNNCTEYAKQEFVVPMVNALTWQTTHTSAFVMMIILVHSVKRSSIHASQSLAKMVVFVKAGHQHILVDASQVKAITKIDFLIIEKSVTEAP